MKKYISLILILFFLLNNNFILSAYPEDIKVTQNTLYQYNLNDEYKQNFLSSNDSNFNYIYSIDEDLEKPINPNWIVLNLLFPGLGNLAVGEFIGGSILFILALAPIIYFTFLPRDGAGGVGYSLSALFIGIPVFLIIYIINLFVTNSIHSDLSKKYKKYYKMKQQETNIKVDSNSDNLSFI